VCRDVEPSHPQYIVCNEQVGGDPGAPYTGSECEAAGLPPVCVIDFAAHAAIRAQMTLIMDEDVTSGLGNPDGLGTALVLDFRLGNRRHVLSEIFEGDKLGRWNPISDEGDLFFPIPFAVSDGEGFQLIDGNLAPLAVEVLAIADAHFRADLSDTLPLVIRADPVPGRVDSDHSGDELASATLQRVIVRFARLRP
jgi:hypothetical protein